jgi:ubiquinone/menaquinone biosynthesis C-methylase UbiE
MLDVGSGTGVLARAAISFASSTMVTGIDPEAGYVAFAREAVAGAHFQVAAAEALPFANSSFDMALALLVLQDFADPATATQEMARVTRPGGTVAACLWDFEHGLPMLSLAWQAAEIAAPEAVARRRESTRPARPALAEIAELWRSSGLSDVTTTTLELPMHFSSFEDYWEPFLGGATPMSAFMSALNAETGGRLAAALRQRIGNVEPDGSFVLAARAWAVKGMRGAGARDNDAALL